MEIKDIREDREYIGDVVTWAWYWIIMMTIHILAVDLFLNNHITMTTMKVIGTFSWAFSMIFVLEIGILIHYLTNPLWKALIKGTKEAKYGYE